MRLQRSPSMTSKIRSRITTPAQREAALDRVAELAGSRPGTPEHAEMTILLIAIDAYRAKPLRRHDMQGHTLH